MVVISASIDAESTTVQGSSTQTAVKHSVFNYGFVQSVRKKKLKTIFQDLQYV